MEPLTQPQPIPIPDKDRIVSLRAGYSVLIDANYIKAIQKALPAELRFHDEYARPLSKFEDAPAGDKVYEGKSQ